MEKGEKAPRRRGIEVPQFAELVACVLKQLPRDIDSDIAQQWIKDPRALGKALRDALCPPLSILDRVRASGYLDTSFGREVYPLAIRPLTKEQALAEYRNSGGKTWVWDELEKNTPYSVPRTEMLYVMILNFGDIESDEAGAEMDTLGVRPLTYERLIPYGTAYPEHQKQKVLVGLGTKHFLGGDPHVPILLSVGSDGRGLDAVQWGGVWGGRCRFPVVRK